MLEWKELSRTGIDIHANLGTALRAKQYLVIKKSLALSEKRKSLDVLYDVNPVVWLDNYSKFFAFTYYQVAIGPFYEANYTAMAFMYDPTHTPDMRLLYLRSGAVVPSSHSIMLKDTFRTRCTRTFSQYDDYKEVLFYDDCKVCFISSSFIYLTYY